MPLSVRNFLIAFFVSLVIFGVIAFLLCSYIVAIFESGNLQGNPGDTSDTETGDPLTPGEGIKGDSFNILLIGTDYQPDILYDYNPAIAALYPKFKRLTLEELYPSLEAGNYRRISPDTIIILRISKETQQFMFTALPTNMLVEVGGAETTLGNIYQDEGFDFFCSKINGITGLSIDYSVIADIKGLAKAVDLVGGITYTVPVAMNYSDPSQNLHISLKAGAQVLYGDQALQLLRYNNYTSGSHSRLKTGISFLRAVVAKMTNIIYLTHIETYYEKISPYFTTDFTINDLRDHLDLIFKYPDFKTVEVSYPGAYIEKDGETYFKPDVKKALAAYSSYR